MALGVSGCLPSITDLDSGPLISDFAVSDYFTPSGYMGDGELFGSMVGTTNQGCKQRPDGARGNCYTFKYYPNTIDKDAWAGVFWVFPANSWGSTFGHAIDMEKFKSISFYAAIEGPTPYTVGGQAQGFNGIAGGINPLGFFHNKDPEAKDYQDGVKASVTLDIGTDVTTELKQFRIALTDYNKAIGCTLPGDPRVGQNCRFIKDANGQDTDVQVPTDLIGAFAWSLHYPVDSTTCRPPPPPAVPGDPPLPADWCHTDQHSSQFINPAPVTIYLDSIVWETQ